MKFTVFRGTAATYLLVPDCLKASLAAEHLHGPLIHCGSVESDSIPQPQLWETVMADVDARLYAVVSETVARNLLGVECGERKRRAKEMHAPHQ